jgi:hypothetical protein
MVPEDMLGLEDLKREWQAAERNRILNALDAKLRVMGKLLPDSRFDEGYLEAVLSLHIWMVAQADGTAER